MHTFGVSAIAIQHGDSIGDSAPAGAEKLINV
jgi:hypothetical protein